MFEVLGDYIESGETREYLIISFSPSILPIQDRWRNNSLSAEFLADYWGSFFPVSDSHSRKKQAEVRDSVSFIANELLENAVKFGNDTKDYPVKIGLYLTGNYLRFYVTNSLEPDYVSDFLVYIRDLLSYDPKELYFRQLEEESEREEEFSRLGFLTLVNDYDATLGWKFETVSSQPLIVTVTTMVQIEVQRN